MSKLLTEPKTGYVKPKDGASSGIYPKTLVDAVYNEEKGESLSETLKNLESRGGGGGISDDMTYEEQQEARKNLGLYYTADFISYGEGKVVQLNSVTNALRFDIAAVLNGKQSLIEDYDEIIAALPTYEEIVASGGLYDSGGLNTHFRKVSEKTTYLEGEYDYYISQGSDSAPSGLSVGDYHFSAPGVYAVLYDQEGDHPNPQLTWTKDLKIPSEYLPEVDLSNAKIPGYVYMTVDNNLSLTNISIEEVASILHTTVAELNALFATGANTPYVAMLVLRGNDSPGNSPRPDYYYSRYELYQNRIGYSEVSPIIMTSGSDEILELGQPETPYYQHLKLTKHSNNQYDVLINSPD